MLYDLNTEMKVIVFNDRIQVGVLCVTIFSLKHFFFVERDNL